MSKATSGYACLVAVVSIVMDGYSRRGGRLQLHSWVVGCALGQS